MLTGPALAGGKDFEQFEGGASIGDEVEAGSELSGATAETIAARKEKQEELNKEMGGDRPNDTIDVTKSFFHPGYNYNVLNHKTGEKQTVTNDMNYRP